MATSREFILNFPDAQFQLLLANDRNDALTLALDIEAGDDL